MKKDLHNTLESIRNKIEINNISDCNKAYNDGFNQFIEQVKDDEFPMPSDIELEFFSDVLNEMECGGDSFTHIDEFNKYVEGWNDAKLVIHEQRVKEKCK